MADTPHWLAEHRLVTRRFFLQSGTLGIAAWKLSPLAVGEDAPASGQAALDAELAKLEYLTPWDDFRLIERGEPLPYTHPLEKLQEVGLTRETWKLEVISDPDAPAKLDCPLSRELGTALDWQGLMRLAETRAVRYLKVMTCNNIDTPLGMGLWEGVPLRDVIWLAKPVENVRRVFYYGYHNDAPKQIFQSSLPIGRVLEDPPGEYPVLLCYKLNGEFLDGKRGGPVRMLVPEAYGFKSVKWLIRVVLSNGAFGNDTYANGNNDVDSGLKTSARIISRPAKVRANQPIPVTGLAQVGISGLTRVEFSIAPQEPAWPAEDPWFTRADWKPAEILPPPQNYGGGLLDGKIPAGTQGFDESSGKPATWPLRHSIVHWGILIAGLAPGKYDLRCRTIDARGHAQPLPRPFQKSGGNAIQTLPLIVEAG